MGREGGVGIGDGVGKGGGVGRGVVWPEGWGGQRGELGRGVGLWAEGVEWWRGCG